MESVKRLICMLLAFLCIGGCSSRQTVLEEQPQEPQQSAKNEVDNAPSNLFPPKQKSQNLFCRLRRESSALIPDMK